MATNPVITAAASAGLPGTGTITVTAASEVIVSPWCDGDLLSHIYKQAGARLVGALELDELTLWYDDEGRLVNDPQTNTLATKLCGRHGPLISDIVGDVVLTGPADSAGRTLPLTREQLHRTLGLLDQLRRQRMPRIRSGSKIHPYVVVVDGRLVGTSFDLDRAAIVAGARVVETASANGGSAEAQVVNASTGETVYAATVDAGTFTESRY